MPERPGAWLTTTARRRALNLIRHARVLHGAHEAIGRAMGDAASLDAIEASLEADVPDDVPDDVLRLMFIACHPSLSRESRVALTLRVVGGLSTDEIARAFLAPEATVAQRIVRAKRALADARVPFELPARADVPDDAVVSDVPTASDAVGASDVVVPADASSPPTSGCAARCCVETASTSSSPSALWLLAGALCASTRRRRRGARGVTPARSDGWHLYPYGERGTPVASHEETFVDSSEGSGRRRAGRAKAVGLLIVTPQGRGVVLRHLVVASHSMNASRPIDHARAGNLDALGDLASTDLRAAYLWLLVAHDLEHEDAQDALGDLEEHCNELKYDDDGLVRLGIRLELASAYLRGKLGLDVDLALAERHVEAALELAPAVDGGPEQVLRDLLVDLEGDAAELIRARLACEPFHAIRRAVDRVQRLHEVKAPEAILDAECARLRGAVARALEVVRSTI